MRIPQRIKVEPGDQVTVAIQHSTRRALRPLIGLLRTVQVTADRRAVILDDDGNRYRVDNRVIPPVSLRDVSIFTDPESGAMWAETYQLPPRDTTAFPVPDHYRAGAQPDGRGGIAWFLRCRCGRGCVCDTCGDTLIGMATDSGLEWWTRSLSDSGTHSFRRCGQPARCGPPRRSGTMPTGYTPECCALPMMLAPVAWVCRRESVHRRPYLWRQQFAAVADH